MEIIYEPSAVCARYLMCPKLLSLIHTKLYHFQCCIIKKNINFFILPSSMFFILLKVISSRVLFMVLMVKFTQTECANFLKLYTLKKNPKINLSLSYFWFNTTFIRWFMFHHIKSILGKKLKIERKLKSSKNFSLKECVSIIFALTKQARTNRAHQKTQREK